MWPQRIPIVKKNLFLEESTGQVYWMPSGFLGAFEGDVCLILISIFYGAYIIIHVMAKVRCV